MLLVHMVFQCREEGSVACLFGLSVQVGGEELCWFIWPYNGRRGGSVAGSVGLLVGGGVLLFSFGLLESDVGSFGLSADCRFLGSHVMEDL